MPYKEQVLVITKLAPVRFETLDAALKSPVAEFDDVAYENLDHFLRATKANHINQLISMWELDIPRDADLDSEEVKRTVWEKLMAMSVNEDTAKKNKTKPAPEPQKKEAAEEKPAPKKEKRSVGTTRKKWADEDRIYLNVKENPKRGNAKERFALYRDGMTVREYLDAGGNRTDVNWDERHGHITIKKGEEDGGT